MPSFGGNGSIQWKAALLMAMLFGARIAGVAAERAERAHRTRASSLEMDEKKELQLIRQRGETALHTGKSGRCGCGMQNLLRCVGVSNSGGAALFNIVALLALTTEQIPEGWAACGGPEIGCTLASVTFVGSAFGVQGIVDRQEERSQEIAGFAAQLGDANNTALQNLKKCYYEDAGTKKVHTLLIPALCIANLMVNLLKFEALEGWPTNAKNILAGFLTLALVISNWWRAENNQKKCGDLRRKVAEEILALNEARNNRNDLESLLQMERAWPDSVKNIEDEEDRKKVMKVISSADFIPDVFGSLVDVAPESIAFDPKKKQCTPRQ